MYERQNEIRIERERERPSFEYINIYLCTEVVTTRLRAGLARAGNLTLHAHTQTDRDNTGKVEPLLGARGFPSLRKNNEGIVQKRKRQP